ncbi:MAG: dockerin type I domain-containing protein [Phycisphaerae bacterium]
MTRAIRPFGMFLAALAWIATGPVLATDYTWRNPVDGNSSVPENWNPTGTPDSTSLVTLPAFSNQSYTVNHDVDGWTVNDLKAYGYATAHLNGHGLTVNSGGDFYNYSTLKITNATYNPTGTVSLHDYAVLRLVNGTVAGYVNTAAGTSILGYGTISNNLTNNAGLIRAENGQLNITLAGDSHNSGTLSALSGATLYIGNTADIKNGDTISPAGGTIKGYQYALYTLVNGTSSAGHLISGYGTIDRYYVRNTGSGGDAGTIRPTGGTLTLNYGFLNGEQWGIIELPSGGTLSVPNNPWTNYATITMTGGSITGQTMSQNSGSGLTVTSGSANAIQNVTFNSGATISGGATLTITGTGTLNGVTLAESGAGGYFNVGSGALVQGRGAIYPDVTVNGTLAANSNGNTLALNGTLNVASGKSAFATGGGTLDLANAVYNRGSVYANSGTVNVTGTIKAGSAETGDFAATAGALNLATATVESNVRNTFTANSGGTVTLWGNPNTATLYLGEPLRPRGGTITVGSGQTLTNASGKSITGYGTLLGDGLALSNQGVIEANGGTLDVHGNITNTGTMRAAGGFTLNVGSTLTNSNQIYASANSTVNLNSADLTNNGSIYTNGSNALIAVADATPQGSGSFTAGPGGTLRFAGGFTNANLSQTSPLLLVGGTITVSSGSMTNASTKSISGNGVLLDPGTMLINEGTIAASGGALKIYADVSNSGILRATGSYPVNVLGSLTNSVTGVVRSENGAAVTLSGVTNAGTVEVVNGGGTGTVTCNGNADGAGLYSLQNGRMVFRQDLVMPDGGRILDSGVSSRIEVMGNLSKQGNAAGFTAEHIDMRLYSDGAAVPQLKSVDWQAQDRGAILLGLDNNLALGHLTFGDGEGPPGSDRFVLSPQTTIYCYGLTISADADVDLGGRTIYYLRAGVVHNGIQGTGFENLGQYANGNIIELAPSKGDFDADGDVDLTDFARFQKCFNGPNRPPTNFGCGNADFEPDGDVDLADFAVFQSCFNGPNRPPAAGCP